MRDADRADTDHTELVRTLQEHGYHLPFHVAVVASNGTFAFFRHDQDEEGEITTDVTIEWPPNGTFELPVHLLYVDARGEATRVVVPRYEDWPASEPAK